MELYRENLKNDGFDVERLDQLCKEIRSNLCRYGISIDHVDVNEIDRQLYNIHYYRFHSNESISLRNYHTITSWGSILSMNLEESLVSLCKQLLPVCECLKDEKRYLMLIIRAVLDKRLNLDADVDSIVSGVYHSRLYGYSSFFEYRRSSYSTMEKMLTWRGLPGLYVILSIAVGILLLFTFKVKLPADYWEDLWPMFGLVCVFPLLFYCFSGIEDEGKAKKSVSICEFGLAAIYLLVLCSLVIWCHFNYYSADMSTGVGFAVAAVNHLIFGILSLFFAKRFGFLLSLPSK